MENSRPLEGDVERQISAHDLISLDVFDTLILRTVDKPKDVFSLVKLRLLNHPETLLDPQTLDGFPVLRAEAERQARNIKEKALGTREVTYDEVYEQVACLSGARPSFIELLKQTELELELSVAYPNPEARRILRLARERNKKVVLCSDMYLPAEFIEKLLAKCGYDRFENLYVSCEHARSKHEGTFLPYIAGKHGVDANRILHIGDNENSDCVQARAAGCTAIHLPLPKVTPRPSIPSPGERPFYFQTVQSAIRGILRKRAAAADAQDAWESIGYRVFGPLFTGFLYWVTGMVERNRPDKILLFARDTHFLNRHLPRFLEPRGIDIPVEYVYVSRRSLLLPSFTDYPLTRLWHLFSGKSHRTVADHLQNLGMTPQQHANTVLSSGFESLTDTVPNGDPRMHALLTKLFQPLLLEGARLRPLARRYVEAAVGEARRLMLVDIGWVGNMQSSFLRLLEPRTGDLQVRGYYVGLHGYAKENDYPPHTMEGWLTHYGNPDLMEKKVFWEGGVELLEFALCAPHGTTLGYRLTDDGEVEPILESSQTDAETQALSARVQTGAGQFLNDFLETFGSLPAAALNSRAWGDEFFRLVTDPTREEADRLGELTHSDSAGDTRRRLPLAPFVPGGLPADIEKARERAFWKAAFDVRNGKTGKAGAA